jgi:hypothetical protein
MLTDVDGILGQSCSSDLVAFSRIAAVAVAVSVDADGDVSDMTVQDRIG